VEEVFKVDAVALQLGLRVRDHPLDVA
jgi:hypothetical protein